MTETIHERVIFNFYHGENKYMFGDDDCLYSNHNLSLVFIVVPWLTCVTNDHRYVPFNVIIIRSLTTQHQMCCKCTMTGATIGVGTAYPSRAPEFTTGLQCGSCCSIFNFMCSSFSIIVSFFDIFPLVVFCPSSIAPLIFPNFSLKSLV